MERCRRRQDGARSADSSRGEKARSTDPLYSPPARSYEPLLTFQDPVRYARPAPRCAAPVRGLARRFRRRVARSPLWTLEIVSGIVVLELCGSPRIFPEQATPGAVLPPHRRRPAAARVLLAPAAAVAHLLADHDRIPPRTENHPARYHLPLRRTWFVWLTLNPPQMARPPTRACLPSPREPSPRTQTLSGQPSLPSGRTKLL